jgi:hypothetical protein
MRQLNTHTHFVIHICRYYKSKEHSEYMQPIEENQEKVAENHPFIHSDLCYTRSYDHFCCFCPKISNLVKVRNVNIMEISSLTYPNIYN